MAASNVLEARITGDISDLKAKLSQADKLVDGYSKNWSNAQIGLRNATRASRDAQAQMARLNRELEEGRISQKQYSDALEQTQREYDTAEQQTRKYQRQLTRLKRELKDAENASENYNAQLSTTPKATQQAAGATKTFGAGMSTMNKTVRGTTPTLTSFSQVIQDAPYGIRGVANNIQQLTAQFGYMSQQAGGARNAFKSLVAGLTGPAGILLAVSAVTTILVQYGDEILNFINGTNSAAEAAKEFRKQQEELTQTLEDYKDTLDVVNRAELVGSQDATSRINTLKLLKNQLDNVSLSEEDRVKAFSELQKIYPSQFANIDKELALNGGLEKSYNSLISLLEDKQKATASKEILDSLTRQRINLDAQLKPLYQQLRAQQSIVDRYREIEVAAIKSGRPSGINLETQVSASTALAEQKERINELEKTRIDLTKQINRLTSNIQNRGGIVPLDFELPDIDDERKFFNNEIEFFNVSDLKKSIGEGLSELEKAFGDTPSIGLEGLFNASNFAQIELPPINPERYIESVKRAVEWSNILSSAVGSSFRAMSAEVVNAMDIQNNILNAFVSSIINSLSTIASEFLSSVIFQSLIGKKKIAIEQGKSNANAITIATNAAAALGPFGIAALPGLIASQLALVNGAFAGIQAFAQGGIVGGGSFTGDRVPILANSGEMILNNGQQSSLFKMINNRVGAMNRGQEELRVEVFGRISGRDIELASNRYNTRRGRIN